MILLFARRWDTHTRKAKFGERNIEPEAGIRSPLQIRRAEHDQNKNDMIEWSTHAPQRTLALISSIA